MSISLFDSLYKRQAGVKMEKVTWRWLWEVRRIMFHDDVGLCIINFDSSPLPYLSHTHKRRAQARGKLFQSNLNLMTEGQKYYFKQIRILITFPETSSSSLGSGSPTCLGFSVYFWLYPYISPHTASSPRLDRSAHDVNNLTYTCEVGCCTQKSLRCEWKFFTVFPVRWTFANSQL
jgi:hypothetical protein